MERGWVGIEEPPPDHPDSVARSVEEQIRRENMERLRRHIAEYEANPSTVSLAELCRQREAALAIPENLKTEEFRAAWDLWLNFRREKRKYSSPVQHQEQLAVLSSWGPERAVAAIHHSIARELIPINEPPAGEQAAAAGAGGQEESG
jgi:hypothetical protein